MSEQLDFVTPRTLAILHAAYRHQRAKGKPMFLQVGKSKGDEIQTPWFIELLTNLGYLHYTNTKRGCHQGKLLHVTDKGVEFIRWATDALVKRSAEDRERE